MLEPFTVAVVGAGFSGVMTAVHLLRMREDRPVRVIMINRSGLMARGVAYGTNSPAHFLNVPAGRMSAFPDDPNHFLRFAQSRDAATEAGTFVRRSVYGEYLEDTLQAAVGVGTPNTLEQVIGAVATIEPNADGVAIVTSTGEWVRADRVVLAVGNYPPAHPPGLAAGFISSPNYIRDPWAAGAMAAVPTTAPALLVGTGLTMLDVALDLHARGVPGAIAVSRRGLIPQPHDPTVSPAEASHRPSGMEGQNTIASFVQSVRARIQERAKEGGNWRQVIDSLRGITPELWQRLDTAERARFLRHARPYWDVHRHRAAPQVRQSVEVLRNSGWLSVRAARLLGAEADVSGVVVRFSPRGTDSVERVRVGAVVNCTGPASDVRSANDPLLTDLFSRGLAAADPLGLGIGVGADGAVLAADGSASPVMYYVGPLIRARDGEGTAVPELRIQAARVAGSIVVRLRDSMHGRASVA